MDRLSRKIQNLIRLTGRKGCLLFLISSIASLGVAGADYGIAIFLMLFMFTLHLIETPQLPSWLPTAMLTASPEWIWGVLFLVVATKSICDVFTYQAKILFTEHTHARMRALLGYEMLQREDGSVPLPLSDINLYMVEMFPKATSFIFHFTQFFTFCVQAAMIIAGMFFLCWSETIVGVIAMGLMGLVVLGFNRHTNKIAQKVPETQAALERTKVRIIRNRLLIRILRLQDREYATYCNSIYLYYKQSVTAYFWGNLGGSLIPVLGAFVVAAIVILNLRVFHNPTANLVAFLYLFVRFQQRVANLSNMIGGLFIDRAQFRQTAALFASYSKQELAAALSPVRGFKVLKPGPVLPLATGSDPGDETDSPGSICLNQSRSLKIDNGPPGIHLSNVTFSWPGATRPVFENISLAVPPGSQLGIMGENGSGKSTLLNVITGVLRPQNGQVYIGRMASETYLKRASECIGYVGPEPFLLYGSIRANLTYGLGREVSEADIWEVLRVTGLDGFVKGLPGGMDYVIQENGEGLSSGQKQRLTIARAFFRQPSLLILDEPLSNVDEATEKIIVEALTAMKGSCTTIIVSHRFETLSGADRVFHMDKTRNGERQRDDRGKIHIFS